MQRAIEVVRKAHELKYTPGIVGERVNMCP